MKNRAMPTFIFKIKERPKTRKGADLKPCFKFIRKNDESIRCEKNDSKFFIDTETVNKKTSANIETPARDVFAIQPGERVVDQNMNEKMVGQPSCDVMTGHAVHNIVNRNNVMENMAACDTGNDQHKNNTNYIANNGKNENDVAYNQDSNHNTGNNHVVDNNMAHEMTTRATDSNRPPKSTARNYLKISPAFYHELLDEADSNETKINKLLEMSLHYLSQKEESFKDIHLHVTLEDTHAETLKEIESAIEEYTAEINKWTEIGNQYVNDCIRECDMSRLHITDNAHARTCTQGSTAHVNEMIEQNAARLATVMHKYVDMCKKECEQAYKRIFAMLKNSELDPMSVLKMLARIKRVDE